MKSETFMTDDLKRCRVFHGIVRMGSGEEVPQ